MYRDKHIERCHAHIHYSKDYFNQSARGHAVTVYKLISLVFEMNLFPSLLASFDPTYFLVPS
jgi:hypothetical protein